MPKKKKNQTEGLEAPANHTFSEPAAAQEKGAAASGQTASQAQLPVDVQELIRTTLKVVVAQRRTYGLATTLTSLTRAVNKALENYLKHVPKYAVREFIKSELEAAGYPVFTAVVDYNGTPYEAQVAMLYKNFDEIVEMVKAGRVSSLIRSLILADGIDPAYDKRIDGQAHV